MPHDYTSMLRMLLSSANGNYLAASDTAPPPMLMPEGLGGIGKPLDTRISPSQRGYGPGGIGGLASPPSMKDKLLGVMRDERSDQTLWDKLRMNRLMRLNQGQGA